MSVTMEARLTVRERALLAELAAGHMQHVAARRLGISSRTLRRDMARIYDQLDARTPIQAAAIAARRGLI